MNVKPLSRTEIWASERVWDDKFIVKLESANMLCDADLLSSLNAALSIQTHGPQWPKNSEYPSRSRRRCRPCRQRLAGQSAPRIRGLSSTGRGSAGGNLLFLMGGWVCRVIVAESEARKSFKVEELVTDAVVLWINGNNGRFWGVRKKWCSGDFINVLTVLWLDTECSATLMWSAGELRATAACHERSPV